MAQVPGIAGLAVVGLELTVRAPAVLNQGAGLSAAVVPGLREARPLDAVVIGVDELGVSAHQPSVGVARDSSRVTSGETQADLWPANTDSPSRSTIWAISSR